MWLKYKFILVSCLEVDSRFSFLYIYALAQNTKRGELEKYAGAESINTGTDNAGGDSEETE